ncbi:hypothetical protein E3U43_011720, partial [Larimichthys crocea]
MSADVPLLLRALTLKLSKPHSPSVGCSIAVFPPPASSCRPCVSVCVEYSESPGRLPPMQTLTENKRTAMFPTRPENQP